VALGRRAFSDATLKKVAEFKEVHMIEALTDREIEVLTEAAKGLTNKQIGQELFISDRTVQGHLQNIYQKLGVTTRTEAVSLALQHGLIAMVEGE
jgi:DNA-binding NarL/FixJ family response regulator